MQLISKDAITEPNDLLVAFNNKAPTCQNNCCAISGLSLIKKYSFIGENFVA